MATPREGLDTLRSMAEDDRLAQLCRSYDVVLLTVFGSVLHEDGSPRDLDIAVAFESGTDPDLFGLVDTLMDVTKVGSVDVMDLGRASIVAKDQALSLGEPLYEAADGLYANQQIAAALRRMDTDWLRRLDLELMASGRQSWSLDA